MPALPYTTCEISGCDWRTRPILLPFPNPSDALPRPWPDEYWRAFIVCPGCGQLLSRRHRHIQWAEQDAAAITSYLSNRAWFCMAFDCAAEGCNMQMQLYLEMAAGSSSADIVNNIRSGAIRGNMVCGHPLSIAEPWALFRVLGPIPAYALIDLDSDK